MNKISRQDVLENLINNLDIICNNNNSNTIAFTTDTTAYDVMNLIHELAPICLKQNRKVAILTYQDLKVEKLENVNYIKLDINNYKDTANTELCKDYDCVFVALPNILTSKCYLHFNTYAKDIVFVSKKWKSRIDNINKIKKIIEDTKMNLLGVIYQN